MTDLIEKYTKHINRFAFDFLSYRKRAFDRNSNAPTCLIDAVCTEILLPCAPATFPTYTHAIETDIHRMIEEIPDCLKSTVGTLRCRDYLSPLAIACHNSQIPLHIVKLLLATTHALYGKFEVLNQLIYLLNHNPISIYKDFGEFGGSIGENRVNELKAMFADFNIDVNAVETHLEYLIRINETLLSHPVHSPTKKYILHNYARGIILKYLRLQNDNEDICPICHDAFIDKNDDELKVLVCGHILCNVCMKETEILCPTCRTPL